MRQRSRNTLVLLLVTSLLLLSSNILTGVVSAQSTSIQINFQNVGAPTPNGYIADTGGAYGARNGLTYGWITQASVGGIGVPLDLTGNGRDRGPNPDQLLDTLMHMQLDDTNSNNGVRAKGAWEIALANGTYSVTVSVGDADESNSVHTINAEGQTLINAFVPPAANEFASATASVLVADGQLTIDAIGGTNTKINYVTITSLDGNGAPFIFGSTPGDGSTNVSVTTSISTTELSAGIDPATLDSNSVFLFNEDAQQLVPASLNTTAGADAITLVPSSLLEEFTTYTFNSTSDLTDAAGTPFLPYTATFTTGAAVLGDPGDIAFNRTSAGASPNRYSSLTFGPDGKLYASSIGGGLFSWDVNPDGTLTNETELTGSGGSDLFPGRAIVGLHFDPDATAQNLDFWVTHNQLAGNFQNSEHFTGGISRVTLINGDWVRQDYIEHLPRSRKDHLTNSMDFGTDGAMYFLQGSISAMGDRDNAWSNQPETLLSAALLRLDVDLMDQQVANGEYTLPLNVATGFANEGTGFDNPVGFNLSDANNFGFGDDEIVNGPFYNPQAPDAPLTVFASGIRNAYDVVQHSNGFFYVPTNGSAGGGSGNATSPGTPSPLPPSCDLRVDGQPYTGPSVPAGDGHSTQDDFLFAVEEDGGGYYGHPNPTRCEWVLNNGSATENRTSYPAGVLADPNYQGFAYNFQENKSPNGVVEYRNTFFGGALFERLLVVRYSQKDDIIILTPGPDGNVIDSISGVDDDIPGMANFSDPLELTVNPANGHIYVSEYGASKLTLLTPDDDSDPQPNLVVDAGTLIFDQTVNDGPSASQSFTIGNNGQADLDVTNIQFSGTQGNQFVLTSASSFTVTPGGSAVVSVAFDPTTAGPKVAQVSISSNDGVNTSVQVRGLGEQGTGGTNEPSLQFIMDTFNIPVTVGDDNPATNVIHSNTELQSAALLGDEIDAQSFQKAGNGPVTLEPLAVYGPTGSNPVVTVGWYETGNANSTVDLFNVDNSPQSNGQRLNPPTNGTLSFDPGSTDFGFFSRWPAFNNRQLFSEDALNTFNGAIPHHVRVYPLKTSTGAQVPNAYIIATEEHVSGFDFQDVVFIAYNIQPVAPEPGDVLVQVNFQDETGAVPADYLRDFGEPFGLRDGANQGGGQYSYGWVLESDLTTLVDISNNGRDRDENNSPDQRYDTIMHMQYNDVGGNNGTATAAAWELALPNGDYSVTVVLGDPDTLGDAPENYHLSVEGQKLLDGFTPPSTGAGTLSQFVEVTTVATINDGRLTIDATGGTNTKIAFLTVTSTGPDEDDPVVQIDVAGVLDSGAYQNTATVTITADDGAFGSGIDSVEYSVNSGNFQAYTAPVVFNTPGSYTVEAQATDNAGNTSAVASVSFDVTEVDSGDLSIVNADWATLNTQNIAELDYLNTWLTMSRINNVNQHLTHDTARLILTNESQSESLFITGLTISDTSEFILPNNEDQTLPLAIAPGDSYDLDVQFVENAGGKGVREQTLTMTTSDTDNSEVVVQLRGGYMQQPEGGSEIWHYHIADAFGFDINFGVPDQPFVFSSAYEAQGDEIMTFNWMRSDDNQSTYVRQLAAFHGCSANNPDSQDVPFRLQGQSGFDHEGRYCQSLLPANDDSTDSLADPAHKLYETTGGSFWMHAAGYRTDRCESVNNCNSHGFRTWPIYNPDGELVPNVVLAIQDYVANGCGAGSANCDYNDNMYLITNVQPALEADRNVDLTVDITEADDPIGINTPTTYTVDVLNDSVFQATNVSLEVTLTGFSAISDDAGCNLSGSTLTCDMGNMVGQATATVTVTGTPTAEGTVTVSALVSNDVADSDTTNNTATEDTDVIDPSNLPGTLTVIKEAAPEGDTEFSFTVNGPDEFVATDLLIDNSSAASGEVIQVNFQNQAADLPDGYLMDFGQAFGPRTAANQGGGQYSYGWVAEEDANTLNAAGVDVSTGGNPPGNGRDRELATDQRLDTIMHMQYEDVNGGTGTNGVVDEVAWEIALPEGTYRVTVAAGDPEQDGTAANISTHVINLEGQNVIAAFQSTGPEGSVDRHQIVTVDVEVTDGRLSIDAIGGFNAKINYVEIEPLVSPNTVIYDVAPGEYTITEAVPFNWALTDITCTGDSGQTPVINGIMVTVSGGADVVCTFTNEQQVPNQAPVAVDDSITMVETDASVTIAVLANDTDADGTLNPATVDLDPDNDAAIDTEFNTSNGTFTYDETTQLVTFVPEAGFTGTVFIEYNVEDDDGLQSNLATITVTVDPVVVADDCSPLSPESCDTVPVTLGSQFCLAFDGNAGGLVDATGIGTGFTMVDAPAQRIAADDPVTYPDIPGYEPRLLSVNNGVLTMSAPKGIQYRYIGYNNSSGQIVNSQVNQLGVGFDGTSEFTIEVTILNESVIPGSAAQGGIWFGLDEDNFVKLVRDTGRVQLQVEVNGGTAVDETATPEEVNTTFGMTAGDTVALLLTINPETNEASGQYILNDGAPVDAGTLPIPASFTDGVLLPDATTGPVSFGGLFTTYRNGNTSFDLNFDDFCITPAAPQIVSPTANDDVATVDEGSSVLIDVLDNDTDGTNAIDATTVTVVDVPVAGVTVDPVTGDITYDATNIAAGVYTFDYTVADTAGNTSEPATVTVTVNEVVVVVAPTANDDTASVQTGETVVINVVANDDDGSAAIAPATVVLGTPSAENVFTNNNDGTVTFDATSADVDLYTVTYTVDDVNGETSNEATITVQVTPEPITGPTITDISAQTNAEGDTVSLQVDVTSTPNGSFFLYSAMGLPEGLSINSSTGLISGEVAYQTGHDEPTYNVIVVVTDVGVPLVSSYKSFNWTITDTNRAPMVYTPANQISTEGDFINLQIAAADLDEDSLTYAAQGLPADLTMNATGLISGTLAEGSAGAYTVDVTVNDGIVDTVVSFDWSVGPDNSVDNQPPTLTTIEDMTAAEGDTVSFSVAGNASDADGDDLLYAASNLPAGLSMDANSGEITGTLDYETAGSGTFLVMVSDNGTPAMSTWTNVNYTITDTNRAPDVNVVLSPATYVDTAVNGVSIVTASDPDGNGLSYAADGLPAGLTMATATGIVSGTPTAETGIYPFTVTVTDDGTPAESTVVNATWTLIDVCVVENLPPVANATASPNNVILNNVGDSVTVTLDASASSDDGNPGPLSYAWYVGTDTSSGVVFSTDALTTVNVQAGVYNYTVLVSDGDLTDTATVTVVINDPDPENIAPVITSTTANPSVATADSIGGTATISLAGVATDPDNGPQNMVYAWFSSGQQIATGTNASVELGADTYSITLHVSDGEDTTVSNPISVTVTDPAANQPPVVSATVSPQQVTLPQIGDTATITLDASGTTDTDGPQALTYTWFNGNAQLTTGETAQVELGAGTYSITVQVFDGENTVTSTAFPVVINNPADDGTVLYRINAGGDEVIFDGLTWAADSFFNGGKVTDLPSDITNSNNPIYEVERSSTADETTGFTYAFPVDAGSYTVRLHFAEIWFTNIGGRGPAGEGQRVFDVLIEGNTVLDEYDITADVGTLTAVVKEYTSVNVSDGNLNIEFPPATVNRPTVVGIEVIKLDGGDTTPNQPPQITQADVDPTTGLTDSIGGTATLTLTGAATDADAGDQLTYTWFNNGNEQIATGAQAQVQLLEGNYSITLSVTDGEATVTSAPVAVTLTDPEPQNQAPEITLVDVDPTTGLTDSIGGTATLTLTGAATDADTGDQLTYTWFNNGNEQIATGAQAQVQLPEGNYSITLSVTDGEATVTSTPVAVSLTDPEPQNQPPTINSVSANPNPATTNVVNGTATVTLSVDATDTDQDTLTITWFNGQNQIGMGATPTIQLPAGNYTLTVEVSDGEFTTTGNVNVEVNDPVVEDGMVVTSFTLVNADADTDLFELVDGAIINLSDPQINGTNLNIRANTSGPVDSVVFGFNSNVNFWTENMAPYAIGKDNNGNYQPFNNIQTPGVYTIIATPYSDGNGTGTAGTGLTITITVIDGTANTGDVLPTPPTLPAITTEGCRCEPINR